MRTVLLIIAAGLAIALYRMLSRGGKTFSYGRTQTISFLTDGSEHVIQGTESGSIIITSKTVLIDGLEYIHKPGANEQLQAVMDYDENGLRSIRVFLANGEKQYFIDKSAK
ncbi:MAG: hypothetical protein JSS82_00920 [Bacteroidetes bacterium]|jgi:hypothetical protein|nr:hypothetical protein [Bacteroidota bacterium]